MADEFDMDRVRSAVNDLSYPIMRTDAAVELHSVTLGSGEDDNSQTLGTIVSEMDADVFDSPEAVLDELQSWPHNDTAPDA